jgi:chloramphenicol-sensitive protein RarD
MQHGAIFAALAFTTWGLYPLYFRLLASVSAFEVVLQRAVWSLLVIAVALMVLRRWRWLADLKREPRQLAVYGTSALLISSNWLLYVWAVGSGHVLDASLGYFINPLFNVALGVLVLHERLRAPQWLAVGLAAAGVAWLTFAAGRLPWVALTLAALFSLYGLVRKTARLGALEGLAAETGLMAIVALPLLLWWTLQQQGALLRGDTALLGWLVLLGPLTVLPLLLFTAAARRLPLATLGLLQYISPSLQFVLGVWVFHEAFDSARLLGFALIWSALALYSIDAWRFSVRASVPAPL